MDKKKGLNLHMVTFLLLVVGGLNWLLIGVFQFGIGDLLGGMEAPVTRVIYILIGLAAVYELATHKANCKNCMEMKKGNKTEQNS